MRRATQRTATFLLLLAVFLFGIAHIAALPPFEGYDEVAHWSSIQQIADERHVPVYGRDHLSGDVARYAGPMASATGQPYRAWFANTHDAGAVRGVGPSRFSQGAELNWQAQHPPLYYLLLAPIYRLGGTLDWVHHLFLLRFASWCMAFTGFAWGAVRTQALLRMQSISGARSLIPIIWPFLFPEFFPEFARLTNDALVVLLFAGLWSVTLGVLADRMTLRRAFAFGVLLAAGLLTKAFFLPMTLGVYALLILDAFWRQSLRDLIPACVVIAVCLIPPAAWYLGKLLTTGTLSGGNDFVHLQEAGGLWHGLHSHFSLSHYVLGAVRILAQFAWAGTWSFVHPDRWIVAPIVASLLLGGVFYALGCGTRDVVRLAPLFFIVPFLAGLFYHLLVMVAMNGEGMGTPGWYLQILAAPLSMALAIGWQWHRVQGFLAGYAILFGAAMVPWQLAFFSGCLDRTGTGGGTLIGTGCLIDLGHLHAISQPALAFGALACGCAAVLAAAIVWTTNLGASIATGSTLYEGQT